MRAIGRVIRHCLFLKVGNFKIGGHKFKMREDRFKRDSRDNVCTQSGAYMELTARGSESDGYNYDL